jgi:hypothetical protein
MRGQDQRSGRHAAGQIQSRHVARQAWARAALYGLFWATSLTLAGPVSRLIFHHDYPAGNGLGGFAASVLSGALAGVGVALLACLVAVIWKRARRRLGGPPGRAMDA